jgi:hypothetical protein
MFYFLIEKMENVVQVLQPWIQRRKIVYVKHKHVVFGLLKHLRKRALGRFFMDDGSLNREVIDKLVH